MTDDAREGGRIDVTVPPSGSTAGLPRVERPGGGSVAVGRPRPTLITGGAGFIGCNVAHRLLSAGEPVIVFDNLSRPGVERNAEWLRETHGAAVEIVTADVRDARAVRAAVARARRVYHFAAQVAVTTSLEDPLADFETNARGTLNVLEAVRACAVPPPLLFTSTNKVYGSLDDLPIARGETRYEPAAEAVRRSGISEQWPLEFHSPYGCSKGAADQYVLDYARSYALPAVVLRMSCIYGPRQFGTEDQGWVAHFLIRAIERRPITVYGDGLQVRDVLFVDDLVDAMLAAQAQIDALAGEAYNLGGGPANTTSLLELLELIRELRGERPRVTFVDWRTGDQRYYVSDTSKFERAVGWAPRVGLRDGLVALDDWLMATRAEARHRRVTRAAPAAVVSGGLRASGGLG